MSAVIEGPIVARPTKYGRVFEVDREEVRELVRRRAEAAGYTLAEFASAGAKDELPDDLQEVYDVLHDVLSK